MASPATETNVPNDSSLAARYRRVRQDSLLLLEHLAPEDTVVQSMPDVSPTKWHLAHTSWFFEQFVLLPFFAGRYRVFNDRYHYLFNSYYYTAGDMHARPRRGLLTRPALSDVLEYRRHVDDGIAELLSSEVDVELRQRVALGLEHERQHQELMLTDIKHVFWSSPLKPAVFPERVRVPGAGDRELRFTPGRSGLVDIGHQGAGFCFDNETPRHRALLQPHKIADRPVSNGEYRDFVRDGGYETPELWLSDGWATVNERGWSRPLYWEKDLQSEFSLSGLRNIDDAAPVCHLSYYEADAFARWSGARLPTEFEWESAAATRPVAGNFVDSAAYHPRAADDGQYFGDVWEWTSSPYTAYPGFKPLEGSLGEYNGKFMCNQMTVRGGSCVSSSDHLRASYRSFFYPDARWQFLGLRLATDA